MKKKLQKNRMNKIFYTKVLLAFLLSFMFSELSSNTQIITLSSKESLRKISLKLRNAIKAFLLLIIAGFQFATKSVAYSCQTFLSFAKERIMRKAIIKFALYSFFFLILQLFSTIEVSAQITKGKANVNPPTGGFSIDGNLVSSDTGDWVSGTGTGGFVLSGAGGTPINSSSTYHSVDLWVFPGDNNFRRGDKGDINP